MKDINKDIVDGFTVEPVTKSNWSKFVELFGERGACGNCWCMYYRLSRTDFNEGKTDDSNKLAMKELIWAEKPVGLLGMIEGEPVAWCALAPREDFIKLEKTRVHKRIDDKPVWSIPCFFINKKYRRSGLTVLLLKCAIDYSKRSGIKILEAYPTIPTTERIADSFAWIGLYSSFKNAGFKIVDNTSKNRPMVRYLID